MSASPMLAYSYAIRPVIPIQTRLLASHSDLAAQRDPMQCQSPLGLAELNLVFVAEVCESQLRRVLKFNNAAFAVFEICDLPIPKRSLVTNVSQAAMWKTCRQSEQWAIIGIAIF
jgi:hypothetical protein